MLHHKLTVKTGAKELSHTHTPVVIDITTTLS
jgi:hypothetical protein